jgi:hypothetical protein
MPRIKIKDLPHNLEVSKEEMKRVVGGLSYARISTPMTIFNPMPNPRPLVPFFSVPSGEGDEMSSKCGCMGMPQDPAECMLAP